MITRFPADMIDADALGSYGLSIEETNADGEVVSLRDHLAQGRTLTARDEMFARVLRSCTRIGGADNSGMSEG